MCRWVVIPGGALVIMSVLGLQGQGAAPPKEQLLQERAQVRWENVPKHVLAFYYGWYGNPQVSGRWVHWEKVDEANKKIGSSTHYPALGPYDSHDVNVVDQHCRWAKEAGISGFIASWWAQGDFHDQGMRPLLEGARKHGLSVTAYFEVVHPDNAPTPEGALKDVLYLLERYGKDPAWLKVNGKPVLFVYGRAIGQIGLDGWLEVISEANRRYPGGAVFIGDQISERAARVFDGIHTYNITGSTAGKSPEAIRAWARSTFPRWVKMAGEGREATGRRALTAEGSRSDAPSRFGGGRVTDAAASDVRLRRHAASEGAGVTPSAPTPVTDAAPRTSTTWRIAALTIIPGYDDSKLDRPAPRPITDRHEGETYRVLWEEAIAAHPTWVLITSWNEWHEGSEIEPSVEHGERELKATAAFAAKFRSLPASQR